MQNSPQLLLREARLFRDSGNFLAAGNLAREAFLRGGGPTAMELSAQMTACTRNIYTPAALRAADAHGANLLAHSGRFPILRNTELNLDNGLRYSCAKLHKHIQFSAKGVSFCALTPILPCEENNAAQPLAALRLAGEATRAALLINKAGLCATCPHLKKVDAAEGHKSYGPLDISIALLRPEAYDLPLALEHLAEQGLLAPECGYELQECLSGPQTAQADKIMAIMGKHGLYGFLRTDPEEFRPELCKDLAARRAELTCEMDERSDPAAWEHLRRYCAAGQPDQVSARLTFQNGGLPEQVLQDFMERCHAAGCRKLKVAFNERLEADEFLLACKCLLEEQAFRLDMELDIDQESLDAAIFNRKIALQRAQAGWSRNQSGLPGAWRACPRPRHLAEIAAPPLPNAVGQN